MSPRPTKPKIPYERAKFAKAYNATAIALYRRHHVNKLVQMVAKACGAKPAAPLTSLASAALWRLLRLRAGANAMTPGTAA